MAGVKGRSGGARPGAGRKPAKPRVTKAQRYKTEDPDDFLRAAMRDPAVPFKDRLACALALKKSDKGSAPQGKKQQAQAAADSVVRRSLAPAPAPCKPRLSLVKSA